MVGPTGNALWLWLVAVVLQYQTYFSSTSYPGTAAAQWTLYSISSSSSHLNLTWNEASMFCKSLGGHLPVLNTNPKMNSFISAATKWKAQNILNGDVWTGLYTPNPNNYPDTWEAECTLQEGVLSVWAAGEPDRRGTEFCARYQFSSDRLRTRECFYQFDVVCEFPKGKCLEVSWSGTLDPTSVQTSVQNFIQTSVQTVDINATALDSCWEKCMSYPPTPAGEECVGAQFNTISTRCTAYLGAAFLAIPDPLPNISGSVRAMVKVCFEADVCDCYTRYSYTNASNKPAPAGDTCNNGSFSPIVPTPSKPACLQTSTLSSAQQLEQSTARATTERSSSPHGAGPSWQTTNEVNTRENSSPEASPVVSVTSSNPLEEVYSSTQSHRQYAEPTDTRNAFHFPRRHIHEHLGKGEHRK